MFKKGQLYYADWRDSNQNRHRKSFPDHAAALAHEKRMKAETHSAVRRQKPKERVLVEFPADLLRKTEEAASLLATDRSKFIRTAVEEKVANMEKEKLEQAMAAAYAANAEFDLKVCDDFKHVDGEQAR